MINWTQEMILNHLVFYGVGDKRTFDIYTGGDSGYVTRPLIRYGYIRKCDDGYYGITYKGRCCAEADEAIIKPGSSKNSREKAAKTGYVCALFYMNGIFLSAEVWDWQKYFILSRHWRKIRTSIISTTRFIGMLFYKGLKLAVYLIEDEKMEWQLYAEGSLFFRTYGSQETRADGMLMICPNNAPRIAEKIIRHTMWERRRLITNNFGYENDKPVRYAKSPIRIKTDYQMVLLTDPEDLISTLETIAGIRNIKLDYLKELGGQFEEFRTCEIVNGNDEYCINPQNDLLKFVNLNIENLENPRLTHHVIMREKYKNIAEMIGCDAVYV